MRDAIIWGGVFNLGGWPIPDFFVCAVYLAGGVISVETYFGCNQFLSKPISVDTYFGRYLFWSIPILVETILAHPALSTVLRVLSILANIDTVGQNWRCDSFWLAQIWSVWFGLDSQVLGPKLRLSPEGAGKRFPATRLRPPQ